MDRTIPIFWLLAVVLGALASIGTDCTGAQAQDGAVVPADGAALRVSLALKDAEPTTWDGRIELSQGRVLAVSVLPPRTGKGEANAWKAKSLTPVQKGRRSVHDPKLPPLDRPVVLATVDAPDAANVAIQTPQGEISFVLGEIRPGEPKPFLKGQVRVEREPLTVRLAGAAKEDEDLPAAAIAPDGSAWMVFMAYKHGQAIDLDVVHSRKEFGSLVTKGNGDQLRLMSFDGTKWGPAIPVTRKGLDLWRPALAVDSDGAVWVVWSRNVEGNWDLYARSYRPDADKWSGTTRLTTDAGSDINPAVVTDPTDGRVWVAWQGWRDGSFDILLKPLDGGGETNENALSPGPANAWCPAAAFDSKGRLHVGFDTYERGNYDVKLISDATGPEPRTVDVAFSPKYEARPSVAVDAADRVWVAYEESGANWGKDTGMKWRGPTGQQLYFQREIILRSVEGGQVRQATGRVPCEPISRNYPDAKTRRMSLPRLAFDRDGRLWLAYRRHPNSSGGGEMWSSFVTYRKGAEWATPVRLANSENIMDNRPAMFARSQGGVLLVHSSDGRTNGTRSAKQNDLYCSVARAGEPVEPTELASLPAAGDPPPTVHSNEPEDLHRIRSYRMTAGGKTYQLLRGEFHRHTEMTSHRDQDGTLEEMWRYALDAAGMDWIGNGDHDNGYGVEYLWWVIQKQTDVYHHPPAFNPMFTYERSVTYPSGHRNAMLAYRGVRPLPRIPGGKEPLYGTPEEGSPDIKNFYAYLKHFDGICASHTSGTNMGTDWRDNDPEVEPVVEIFQGLRDSYEHEGAPAATRVPDESIGGYKPLGYVWNALMKGYRLGFEVSSDHYSTHISYAMVWAEEPTREAILDAFKRRHSYGANDNIILDVRCGERMMGDVFTLRRKPTLTIKVIGTRPIARLSIIRGTGGDTPIYVYDTEPNKQHVERTWTDQEPVWGKTSYYYVRVEQARPADGYGALAWGSPMWIEVER